MAVLKVAPWATAFATGAMMAIAAVPFVLLFPEPPAFSQGAVALFATFVTLATVGTCLQAAPRKRIRIVGWAAWLLVTTVAAILLRIAVSGDLLSIPTPDLLPRLFGLQGEDIDDAFLYEIWLELWLTCAVLMLILRGCLHRFVLRSPPLDDSAPPVASSRWSLPTIGMVLVGCAALVGAVLSGHQTADFLAGSVHVIGTIADPQPHPRIRFTAFDGRVVTFVQDGWVSRDLGASVPVAYQTQDPAGTAQADTFWANWTNTLALSWIGLGFTLAPFFGFRAVMQGGRW